MGERGTVFSDSENPFVKQQWQVENVNSPLTPRTESKKLFEQGAGPPMARETNSSQLDVHKHLFLAEDRSDCDLEGEVPGQRTM